MPRSAESWIRKRLKVNRLATTDPRGETIIWDERDVELDGEVIGHQVVHTYLEDFLLMAGPIIEDEAAFKDDAAVWVGLQEKGIVPRG